jgi:hypothetical protein
MQNLLPDDTTTDCPPQCPLGRYCGGPWCLDNCDNPPEGQS